MPEERIVTLTTDFGTADGYVGAMKGSILSIYPKAKIVDLSHEIPSYDVVVGAFHLGCASHYFPKGTVHVGVVDPGVGSARRPILVQTRNHFFVGPDNGLFTLATLRDPVVGIYELKEKKYFRAEVSSTFHGRDLFGPVAAHLAKGVSPSKFGPRLPSLKTLPPFRVRRIPGGWEGEILFFDKFGNALSNLHRSDVGKGAVTDVFWKGRRLPLFKTYSDMPEGKPGALFGSSGFLEVALREKSFENQYRAARSDGIRLLVAS